MGKPAELAPELLGALARVGAAAGIEAYYLGGGTAIGWHLGHRQSAVGMTDAAAHVVLGGVPVDLVRYPYPLLEPPSAGPGGFPVANLRDLAAMKLAAIANRGIRRDFWDLYAIGHAGLTLGDALAAYQARFGREASDLYHVIRALTYFADADREPVLPRGLRQPEWQAMKAWFEEHAAPLLLPSGPE